MVSSVGMLKASLNAFLTSSGDVVGRAMGEVEFQTEVARAWAGSASNGGRIDGDGGFALSELEQEIGVKVWKYLPELAAGGFDAALPRRPICVDM